MANNRKFHNFCANVEVFWNGCPSFIICELNRSETSIPSDQGKQEDSYSPSVLPPPKKMDHWYVSIHQNLHLWHGKLYKKDHLYTQWIVTVKWSWFWDIFIMTILTFTFAHHLAKLWLMKFHLYLLGQSLAWNQWLGMIQACMSPWRCQTTGLDPNSFFLVFFL